MLWKLGCLIPINKKEDEYKDYEIFKKKKNEHLCLEMWLWLFLKVFSLKNISK